MPDLSRIRLDDDERRPTKPPAWVGFVVVLVVMGLMIAAGTVLWQRGAGTEAPAEAMASAETGSAAQGLQARDSTQVAQPTASVAAGGFVEPRRLAALLPSREGVVHSVHVVLGGRVEQGALLVELESEALAADVVGARAGAANARARLEVLQAGARPEELEAARADAQGARAEHEGARRELARLEGLAGIVAAAQVDTARTREQTTRARVASLQARVDQLTAGNRGLEIVALEAEVAQADAAVERAQAFLEETRLRSPFAGTIIRLDVEPGEGMGPLSEPRVEVADLSELRVRVDVPEARVTGIEPGAPAEVFVDAVGGDALEASVVEVAPVGDRQTNTVEVVVRIHTSPPALRPDMSARVTIRRESPHER